MALPKNFRRRIWRFAVVALLTTAFAITPPIVYAFRRRRRWREVTDAIPSHRIEQLCAAIRAGVADPPPMDPVQVIADLQSWLNQRSKTQ